ncbi:MAG: hypothetical protein QGG48_13815, partial [Desulfatiglandales bacterium]|nr:hypothetical protein [Desulfatiglandales bacterium]
LRSVNKLEIWGFAPIGIMECWNNGFWGIFLRENPRDEKLLFKINSTKEGIIDTSLFHARPPRLSGA